MADNADEPESDITDPTSEEHGDVRQRFAELWNERTSGDEGAVALDSAWQPIANLLKGHVSAEKEVAGPVAMDEGRDEVPRSHPGTQ